MRLNTQSLGIEPLQRVILCENRTINTVAIVLDNLLGMNAVQLGHPFLFARSIGAVLRRDEDADMNMPVFQSGDLDLAKQV